MKTIIVTGSVGSGKTTLSKILSKKLNYEYIDVNKIINKYNLPEGYDKKRKTKIIDIKKLNKYLIMEINKNKTKKYNGIIIDSHLSHYLPKKYVDLCIVAKCDLKILEKRLKNRKYTEEKIRENLDTEIFDICLEEAKVKKHKVKVVDTTKEIKINRKIKLLKI